MDQYFSTFKTAIRIKKVIIYSPCNGWGFDDNPASVATDAVTDTVLTFGAPFAEETEELLEEYRPFVKDAFSSSVSST